jgi:hypothetical protein
VPARRPVRRLLLPVSHATVRRASDPLDFGIEDDTKLVASLPIAAPELIEQDGEWFLAALNPGLDGIRVTRLEWTPADGSDAEP